MVFSPNKADCLSNKFVMEHVCLMALKSGTNRVCSLASWLASTLTWENIGTRFLKILHFTSLNALLTFVVVMCHCAWLFSQGRLTQNSKLSNYVNCTQLLS